MNDDFNRGDWSKGCVGIIHLIIRHKNYLTISLLTQHGGGCVNKRLENTRHHAVKNITWPGWDWTQLLITTTQYVTTKPWCHHCQLFYTYFPAWFYSCSHIDIFGWKTIDLDWGLDMSYYVEQTIKRNCRLSGNEATL